MGCYIVPTKSNGNGYSDWKHAMLIGLSVENKLCFVDGTLKRHVITVPTYPACKGVMIL